MVYYTELVDPEFDDDQPPFIFDLFSGLLEFTYTPMSGAGQL